MPGQETDGGAEARRSTEADPYELLGVARDASQADIRWAYERLLNQASKNGAIAQATALSRAYDVLSHPARREVYDRFGMTPLRERSPGVSPLHPVRWRSDSPAPAASTPNRTQSRPDVRRAPRRVPTSVVFTAGIVAGLIVAAFLFRAAQAPPSQPAEPQVSKTVICQVSPGGSGYSYRAPLAAPATCRNGAAPKVVTP